MTDIVETSPTPAAGRLTQEEAELIRRTEELIPALRERAQEAEDLRRLPDATVQDAIDIGLFQALAPPRWGGSGMGLTAFVEITRRLARGCASSAWTLSFLMEHNWMFAKFPLEAQEEAFAGRPFVLGATTAIPKPPEGAGAEKVTGGYRVRGRWGFASGVMHSEWTILVCKVAADRPEDAEQYVFLIPMSELRIDDIWHMSGMRATGSNDIVAEDVFVPEHRALPGRVWMSGDNPGAEVHPDFPLLRYELTALTNCGLAPIALGAAEASLELWAERMPQRQFGLAGLATQKQTESPTSIRRYGWMVGKLRVAQMLLENGLAKVVDNYGLVSSMGDHEQAALRLDMTNCAHMSSQVIDEVCMASGGRIWHASNPLQRFRRDIDVVLGHHINDIDYVEETAGRILLDLAPADPWF